jgi:serine/threonine protein phosphatase PrpC
MTGAPTVCPRCSAIGRSADRFCESCGASLSGIRWVAVPRELQVHNGSQEPCADCGNETHVDGYCTRCGHRRVGPDRDEAALDSVVLITDRGLEHARNEDAAAAGIVEGRDDMPDALAVAVCDGVSSSGEAHRAAVAASRAGVEAMLGALAASRNGRAAVLAGLAAAAKAAVAAWTGTEDPSAAPSCTYAAVTVVPSPTGTVQVTVGNVGDGRVYWLPEPPAATQRLTVDDSVAQELITAGVSADSDAVRAGAHTLTRWLGADAGSTPWSESNVRTITAVGRGCLVICSDGLWNYLPDADDIARFFAGTEPSAAARALTDHALRSGGQDNITVAVIPIGGAS